MTLTGTVHLHFFHKPVCTSAFKLLYGLSNNKYNHALQLSSTPLNQIMHGNVGNLNALQQPSKSQIHYWFTTFLWENGDFDPATGFTHVPAYCSQELLYEMFCIDQNQTYFHIPSIRTFWDHIKSHFPHVKFLKQTRLGRCAFCMDVNHKKHQVLVIN